MSKPISKPKKPDLSKAEEISKKYKQLGKCCNVLSAILKDEEDRFCSHEGWPVWRSDVEGSGVKMNEIFDFMTILLKKRKAELECELSDLQCNK